MSFESRGLLLMAQNSELKTAEIKALSRLQASNTPDSIQTERRNGDITLTLKVSLAWCVWRGDCGLSVVSRFKEEPK
jgi:hypothetical protein